MGYDEFYDLLQKRQVWKGSWPCLHLFTKERHRLVFFRKHSLHLFQNETRHSLSLRILQGLFDGWHRRIHTRQVRWALLSVVLCDRHLFQIRIGTTQRALKSRIALEQRSNAAKMKDMSTRRDKQGLMRPWIAKTDTAAVLGWARSNLPSDPSVEGRIGRWPVQLEPHLHRPIDRFDPALKVHAELNQVAVVDLDRLRSLARGTESDVVQERARGGFRVTEIELAN